MAASVPMIYIICQLFLFITISSADGDAFTSTAIMDDNDNPNGIDNARDNNVINTITPNDDPLSSNSSTNGGGFHLPFEHKQLLAWIIGGIFIWCSIITCCILFIKRGTYFHNRTKSNQHKINISNMMGQLEDIEYHHAGRYNNNIKIQDSNNTSETVEEEEDDHDHIHDIESVEQEEIINTVKTMESKRMSKTDKLVQEFKMRQSQGILKQEVILEIDHARAPSSPVTNPVVGYDMEYSVPVPVEYPLEYVKTPPPPPPPGIALDVVQSPRPNGDGHGQTYANPNPHF